jgi:hypothetical protein
MICAPDHGPHHALGMCQRCYWRARHRATLPPRRPHRGHRTVALVARAERLKDELEAAGDYATIPPTWPAIAAYLGVKPETLKRYRLRVREYQAREAS